MTMTMTVRLTVTVVGMRVRVGIVQGRRRVEGRVVNVHGIHCKLLIFVTV
jgi:hypothetical protein